ncbi:MAG: PhoH family protein [Opitutales bacterium]|jgi:phosphate starvation-inducible PhoH-like protein
MAEKTIHFQNPRTLSQIYCGKEENLALAEQMLAVTLVARDDWLQINGEEDKLAGAETFFDTLREGRQQGLNIRQSDYENILRSVSEGKMDQVRNMFGKEAVSYQFRRKSVVPKTLGQKSYSQAIRSNDVVFGIGPAGTGKTYLAVAAALDALLKEEVEHLILTRPAVEAGEALGYLPGDLQEKIQPYLRPLYDAMFDMLGHDYAQRLLERDVVEIAPLAYMRGRTLAHSFIILDEAQNTTPEQMMMFLTRLGEGSRMVITGDITQVDLPRHKYSGLKEAIDVLSEVPGIAFQYFDSADVVRHPLVGRIVEAYQRYMDTTGAHQRRDPGSSGKLLK